MIVHEEVTVTAIWSIAAILRHSPSRPLAHCANQAPGFIRREGSDTAIPAVILQANGSGVLAQLGEKGRVGETVLGQYVVDDVPFAFRGVVQQVLLNSDGSYNWQIKFLLSIT